MSPTSSFWSELEHKQSDFTPRIALCDYADERVMKSANEISQKKIAKPILIDQRLMSNCDKRQVYLKILAEKQSARHLSLPDVEKQLTDSLYFAIAMLLNGDVEGVVAGSTRPTADVLKAALHCVGPKPNERFISGHFLIESEILSTQNQTPFLFADCAVIPEPSSRALAQVAISAANAYRFFTGKTPKVALLSFSTRGSAEHALVDRIQEALKIIHEQIPDLDVDGEVQVDAAVDHIVAEVKKAKDSPVCGQANVFVFPTLEAANIGYKLVQRFSKCRIAGPLLWGLRKPMSDLSRGCTVQEITDTVHCVVKMIRGMN